MKEIPAYLQRDCHWMRQALEEAHKAAELHEIPVGAVIVYQNEIIARAHNRRELDQDALAHAEVLLKTGQLAIERVRAVCHTGALSDVQRCHHQRPAGPGGIRC